MKLKYINISILLIIMTNACTQERLSSITTPLSFLETRTIKADIKLQVSGSKSIEDFFKIIERHVKDEEFWTRPSIAWYTVTLTSPVNVELNAGESLFQCLHKLANSLGCELYSDEWRILFLPSKNLKIKNELRKKIAKWNDHTPFYGLILLNFSGVFDVDPTGKPFTDFLIAKLNESSERSKLDLPRKITWNNIEPPLKNIGSSKEISLVGDWTFKNFVNVISFYYSVNWTVADGVIVFDSGLLEYVPKKGEVFKTADPF